ncbi:MAG: hypothetical protein ACI8S7_001458, partial [Candidatus Krumholzibacteriia bacterium]
VSDTVSSADLSAVIAGLSACLSDPELMPQSGNMAIGAIVYGDTIATILPLTSVTAETLETRIIPALESLNTDRIVATNGVALSEALRVALGLFSGAGVQDKHILIAGSGEANSATELTAACGEAAAAGVMQSALIFGDNPTQLTVLQDCVAATNGFFAQTGEDFGADCEAALKYMLLVEMSVEPDTAELSRSAEHSVTAMVFRAGDVDAYPVMKHDVAFTVIDGPNVGDTVTVATDSLGAALYAYTGNGGSGMDTIAVASLHPGTGAALADTVTVTWLNTPPTCDAGGPYMATVLSDTATVNLDGSGSIDADGDSLSFVWSVDGEGASFDDASAMNPVLTLTGNAVCADSLSVTLMVTDGADSTSCDTMVQVDDQRAPMIEVRDEPIALWPPNHKYHTITTDMVFESVEDACGNPLDSSAIEILAVSSDEAEDSKGDGRTMDDILIGCPNEVQLRAERSGGNQGRVYTIYYRVTGENGTSTDVDFKVIVPHDQSGRPVVESDGEGYMVEASCGDEG